MKDLGVQPDCLFLVNNEEDECWEIHERNGYAPGEDALVAKFYCAPRAAVFLILALQRLEAELSKALEGD